MKNKDMYLDYMFILVCDNKKDIIRACSKGLKLNGKEYKRFVGTTGGLKNNSLIFISTDIYDELNIKCECNRNPNIPLVPAKYEAYKALVCSTSLPVSRPKGVLVVKDTYTNFKGDVIDIDDSHINKGDNLEPIISYINDLDLENNVTDGSNLISPSYAKRIAEDLNLEYLPSGFCIRNAWCKGMANVIDFHKFITSETLVDIWGNSHNLADIEMIMTESSLKLWECYDNIEHYLSSCEQHGFTFSVTKATPKQLEDTRTLNYQYLQSYEFSDNEISQLIKPTIDFLKNSMGGKYEDVVSFLGLDNETRENDYTKALILNKEMIKDPYVIDKINLLIKKKIDQAKIGKLLVNGNYQTFTLDPYIFLNDLDNKPKDGLLQAGECYSKYWIDRGVDEILVFRSPMTSHNNIRKLKVVNSAQANELYQHLNTMLIVNGFDTFCMAENGEDGDYINSPL